MEEAAILEAVRSGDEVAFGQVTEGYRRELRVHCYRLLGSFDDAEDLVQETLIRAWRGRTGFEGRSSFKNWLYRIATNACLNAIERTPRRITTPDLVPPTEDPGAVPKWAPELPWIQPYPDQLLEPIAPAEVEPESAAIAREAIELVYLAAIQHLPASQRAVLILRDALDWSAQETADLLEMSLSSVNSALHRARETMRRLLPEGHSPRAKGKRPTEEELDVLRAFMDAFERADARAVTELLREDARLTMPPALMWFDGVRSVSAFYDQMLGRFGDFRILATGANTQPAAIAYLRGRGTEAFRLAGVNVLRIQDGKIAEVTSFRPDLCKGFGLSTRL